MQPRDKAHQAAGEMRPLTTSRWLEITAKHHYQGLGGEQPGCTGLSLRGDRGCQGAATAGGWQLRSDLSSENLRLPPTGKIKPRQQSSCSGGQLRSVMLSHQLPALVTASLQGWGAQGAGVAAGATQRRSASVPPSALQESAAASARARKLRSGDGRAPLWLHL